MTAIQRCRSCGHSPLETILDLGRQPLANALRTEEQLKEPEKTFPLVLVWCPKCTLLQITENVSAETLFANYFYLSSYSDAFLKHCATLAYRLVDERALGSDSLVVDIASNDGYLLRFYQGTSIPVLGIEPARNIAAIALKKGIPTLNAFFTLREARRLVSDGKQADIIHAHNVMPHVADQRDFAAGIAALLKPNGIAVIEFAYAIDTIENGEFDQIYHEHMCYFSLTAFTSLCEQCALTVVRVERLHIHGGSLRVFLAHTAEAEPDSTVQELLAKEQAWGVSRVAPYRTFADRTVALRLELLTLLRELKAQGKRIAVYGASAKGSTLMNYVGIDQSLVEYIVDRSTMKQGRYAPGTNLRIYSVKKLLRDRPDYVLLLTWNFADEILAQQERYRAWGGKFIIPVPKPTVV